MPGNTGNEDKEKPAYPVPDTIEYHEEREEIHVSESDIRDLKILDRSDFVFAILYSVLFIWGLVLTLISI
jgi:hypothetical protein